MSHFSQIFIINVLEKNYHLTMLGGISVKSVTLHLFRTFISVSGSNFQYFQMIVWFAHPFDLLVFFYTLLITPSNFVISFLVLFLALLSFPFLSTSLICFEFLLFFDKSLQSCNFCIGPLLAESHSC